MKLMLITDQGTLIEVWEDIADWNLEMPIPSDLLGSEIARTMKRGMKEEEEEKE